MAENAEKKTDERRKELLMERKNGYDRLTDADKAAIGPFAAKYMAFLDAAKTEREAVTETVRLAREAGFRPYERGQAVRPGDKVYRVNRNKAITLAVIGQKPLAEGVRIAAAHIDNPRLDLKPNPLYEDGEMAYFKTHYYGGIKKYHWPVIPLAIHGVVAKKDGSVVTVNIGEAEDDPVLVITDLLIHLASDQLRKSLAEGIPAENLNVLLGSMPLEGDEGADRVKLAVMILLHEKYGITEADFQSAELCVTPAGRAREVGLDRSMIGGFGHDDRVCSYAALAPLLEEDRVPLYTSVCTLADKEEIGSEGVTGMQSAFFDTFIEDLCQAQGGQLRACYEASKCLSADVTNAFDPMFAEVHDQRNNARANYGAAICKYTGARGKSGASDASAELMGWLRRVLEDRGVIWQTAELGKVDQGGGGTVAVYMAKRNIDTVDIGVPVLSMHAPFEVVTKLDLYMTMRAMEAFYQAE